MKNVWLALVGIVMAFSVTAAQFTDGKQYLTLDKPVTGEPQVLEFSLSIAHIVTSLKRFIRYLKQ